MYADQSGNAAAAGLLFGGTQARGTCPHRFLPAGGVPACVQGAERKKTFVAVGILDEPIRWVENDVQVLLLISIADGEHPELQKFYLSITSFMQDTARVKSLIQCRDYALVYAASVWGKRWKQRE